MSYILGRTSFENNTRRGSEVLWYNLLLLNNLNIVATC